MNSSAGVKVETELLNEMPLKAQSHPEFVFQGETAFALVSIGDKYKLSVRFGTDSSSAQNVMQPGDQVSLGLNRRDVIVIPERNDS